MGGKVGTCWWITAGNGIVQEMGKPKPFARFQPLHGHFMYIAYVDGSSPVELDPQTLSRRCGIRRWLLSILTYSNAWPILAKSSQRNNG